VTEAKGVQGLDTMALGEHRIGEFFFGRGFYVGHPAL